MDNSFDSILPHSESTDNQPRCLYYREGWDTFGQSTRIFSNFQSGNWRLTSLGRCPLLTRLDLRCIWPASDSNGSVACDGSLSQRNESAGGRPFTPRRFSRQQAPRSRKRANRRQNNSCLDNSRFNGYLMRFVRQFLFQAPASPKT